MQTLRLLTSYRGYRRGEIIQATPQLAAYLVERQIAERDGQTGLPLQEFRKAETAVVPPAAEQR